MSFHKLIFWIFTSVLLYLAYYNNDGFESNSKGGVLAAMLFITMIGSLTPSDPFGDKYGGIFRMQLWLSAAFISILVFLAFQNEKDEDMYISQITLTYEFRRQQIRQACTKDMHTQDDDCEFEWINIIDNLDHYYWGHVINWLLDTFLVRDFWFQIFDQFQRKLLNYLGNINFHILKNVDGIIYYWMYYQITLLLLLLE